MGTFQTTVSLANVSGGFITGTYTLTLSDGTDSLTGTASVPTTLLSGVTFGTGSATVTGGTGMFAGATGSFPMLSGSGQKTPGGFELSFSGAGTITTTGGTGGTPPPTAPTVTGVTNNYSYIPAGFPNSGIAPSSLFQIFGTDMAAPVTGTLALNSSAGPNGIPQSQNGTSISVTVKGATVTPAMYYATPTSIAAVLPADTPTGTGTLTVTYNNNASNAYSIQVVSSALGLDTYYGTGNGLITATDAAGGLFNYTGSAALGQTIVLWGTGLGADPQDSDTVFTKSPHAVNQSSLKIYFGGVEGDVLYAGASGYPGLNQIDVTIPANAPTGCFVSVVGTVGSDVSNFGTLSIGKNNGECGDPIYGITGDLIGKLSGQTNVKSGSVSIGQSTAPGSNGTPMTYNAASANFQSVTGVSYGAVSGLLSLGSCFVGQMVGSGSISSSTGLNAGSNLSLTGPAGTYAIPATSTGHYQQSLPADAITGSGGTFVFNGPGGSDVGTFTDTVNLPNPLLSWTNQSAAATITRSEGLQVTWTGGASGSYVGIIGSSSGNGVSANFTCLVPQSALKFTVPPYVTGTLPAGAGNVLVENTTSFSTFAATGIDIGFGYGFTGTLVNTTYQ